MKKSAFVFALLFVLTILSPALAQGGGDPEYDKALQYYNTGKFEEAARLFKDYVQKKPTALAYYQLGYALYKIGNYNEAMKNFENAYLIDPMFSPAPFKQAISE